MVGEEVVINEGDIERVLIRNGTVFSRRVLLRTGSLYTAKASGVERLSK